MRIAVHGIKGVPSAIIGYKNHEGLPKYLSVKNGDEFDIDDKSGHQLMAKYADLLKLVSYGDAAEPEAKPVRARSRRSDPERNKIVPPPSAQ